MDNSFLDPSQIENISSLILSYGLNVVGALLILILGWVVSRAARRLTLKRLSKKEGADVTLVKFTANIVRWLILIVAVMAALELFGIKTTSFVALLGAAGLAVGLAFQGTLSNFASGVMLLIFRPFTVGDTVKVSGETGKIDEIGLFMTNMDTFDNRRIIIPNSKIFGAVIETITFHDKRRVEVNVGTDYPANLDEVRQVLERAAKSVESGLEDPAPKVVLQELGGSSINWQVQVWAPTEGSPGYLDIKQETIRQVKRHLDEAGIGIPFPQMDVHLDGALADARN